MLTVINPAGLYDSNNFASSVSALRGALDAKEDYYVLDTDDFIVNKVTYAQLYDIIRSKGVEIHNVAYNNSESYESGLLFYFNKLTNRRLIGNIDYIRPHSFFFNSVKVKQDTRYIVRIWFGGYTHEIQLLLKKPFGCIIQYSMCCDKYNICRDKDVLCKIYCRDIQDYTQPSHIEVLYFFNFKDLIFCKFGIDIFNYILKFNLVFTKVGELVGVVPEPPCRTTWKFLELNNKYMSSDKKISGICAKYLFGRSGGIIKY